ncbi:MAG: TIGR01777 family protein [Nitrospirae bacterium]|nr:MAG: TIGR01777 family protein [Nitrospirota bacterium]
MKIAVSGATGFVGKHLADSFKSKGFEIVQLDRSDFESGSENLQKKIEGAQVVINLAGAPIIGRWTGPYKKILYSSRINTTDMLVNAMSGLDKKPELFISTSAVGVYEKGGPHTEKKYSYSNEFLGRLALDWEKAALKAQNAGIRTVIFRFGVVLGKDGGALAQMLHPFKFGLGGKIGSGEQPFPWVHIKDLVSAYWFVIENQKTEGVYNLTAPENITNKIFTETLAGVLMRPAFFTVPEFILRLKYGDGAKVLIEGQDVRPERLLEAGFQFRFKTISYALTDLLEKQR